MCVLLNSHSHLQLLSFQLSTKHAAPSTKKRAGRHVLLTAYCLVLGAGCAYAPLRTQGAVAPLPLPAEIAAYYAYPHAPADVTITPTGTPRGVREFAVQFPLSASGFEPTEPIVEFEWFESTQPGRRPAVVFNPILGGDYPLERGVCRYLSRNGFHVALVHRKTLKISPEHPVDRIELLLRQGVIRIRQVVDWMEAHERVDAQRMGSFGISMGGIAGVITAAVEPRLKAHVVALAGGGVADILAGSNDSLLAKPRRRYLEKNHMDLAELEAALRRSLKTDPILLAPYVDRRTVSMFIAVADRTIGYGNALRLRRALGRPSTVFLPTGHYSAYLTLPYLKYAGLRFLKEKLQ